MTIPIRNLYYLFCYAWERYPEGDAIDVGVEDCPDLPSLFARVLVNGVNRLLRRGLDRGYLTFDEERRSPRGRILIDQSLKAQTLERGSLYCLVDELSHDVLHNQLLKATALLLARDDRVDSALAHELRLIARRLGDVTDICVFLGLFRRVQLSQNSAQYRQLLCLCEFVWRSSLPEEGGSGSKFGDILRDEERMSRIFEAFLLNFYRQHADGYSVAAEDMRWQFDPTSKGDPTLMPIMRTDMTLRSRTQTLVIDAKFYADPFPRSIGTPKIRASHLYQLFAYMKHASRKSPGVPVDGALIYAAPSGGVVHRYQLDGHEIVIAAIDLSKPWRDVHDDLQAIVTRLAA